MCSVSLILSPSRSLLSLVLFLSPTLVYPLFSMILAACYFTSLVFFFFYRFSSLFVDVSRFLDRFAERSILFFFFSFFKYLYSLKSSFMIFIFSSNDYEYLYNIYIMYVIYIYIVYI